MLVVSAMLPLPAWVQMLPPLGVQVQVKLPEARAAGSGSATTAPRAAEGPALVTAMVYESGACGWYGSGLEALVMARATTGWAGVTAVARHEGVQSGSSTPAGGVITATLLKGVWVAGGTVACMV